VLIALLLYGVSAALADLRAVGAAAQRLGATDWALLLGLSALGYALRFLRWQGYLRRFGHWVPTRPSLVCYLGGFAFTITPGKAGEAVRSLYLKQRGVGYTQSLAALFSERLLDLVAILLLALAGALMLPQGRWLLALGAALILILLPLAQHPGLQRALTRGADRLRPGRPQTLLRHGLELLRASARLLRGPTLWAGLAVGLLAWGAEGLGFYLLLQYLELPATPLLALGIYALSLLAGALSFLPGGLGSTEAAMGLMLLASGADAPSAVAATLIYRLVSLWFAVGLGALALAALGIPAAPRPGREPPAVDP
jgi:uncharacterized membrane protein YbhN (UPF0104 family)